MTDRGRYGVIEVRRINAETYHLTIGGRMWSEVEWSRSRQAWCIQDAAGHCLTHVEHIVGQNRDPQAAIRLAKRMIVDGRMPSPEEALAQLEVEQERTSENATSGDVSAWANRSLWIHRSARTLANRSTWMIRPSG